MVLSSVCSFSSAGVRAPAEHCLSKMWLLGTSSQKPLQYHSPSSAVAAIPKIPSATPARYLNIPEILRLSYRSGVFSATASSLLLQQHFFRDLPPLLDHVDQIHALRVIRNIDAHFSPPHGS